MQELTYFESVAVILYDNAINLLAKTELLPTEQIVWVRAKLERESQEGRNPDHVRKLAGHMVAFCDAELKARATP